MPEEYLGLLSYRVLCLCQTVILKRRILSYMSPPQEEWKFYRLINFDGTPDFCSRQSTKSMFMKLCKHLNQALHYVLHVLHASSCSPPVESEHQAKASSLLIHCKCFLKTSWLGWSEQKSDFDPFNQIQKVLNDPHGWRNYGQCTCSVGITA